MSGYYGGGVLYLSNIGRKTTSTFTGLGTLGYAGYQYGRVKLKEALSNIDATEVVAVGVASVLSKKIHDYSESETVDNKIEKTNEIEKEVNEIIDENKNIEVKEEINAIINTNEDNNNKTIGLLFITLSAILLIKVMKYD